MHRIRITANQVVYFSKVVELDEEKFHELLDAWRDGTDKQLGDIVEDYLDIKNDVVDWDDIGCVDIVDDETRRLLDV